MLRLSGGWCLTIVHLSFFPSCNVANANTALNLCLFMWLTLRFKVFGLLGESKLWSESLKGSSWECFLKRKWLFCPVVYTHKKRIVPFKVQGAMNSSCCMEALMYWVWLLYWRSVKEVFCLQLTYLILLGSMRSMSLSFFQKSCGGGEASTLHSNLTVSPSSAREFIIFWTKVGGRRTSWAAGELEVTQHRQLEGGTSHSRWVYTSITYIKLKILHSLKEKIYPRHRASWWICSPLLGSLPHTHTLLHGAQWRSLWWTSATLFHTPASCGSRLDGWLYHPGTSRCLVSGGLQPGLRGGREVLFQLDFTWMRNLLSLRKYRLEREIHLKVNPTEASLLDREVWRDLQEARGITFLLDSWTLICPPIHPWVVPPPARTETHYSFIIHS